MDDPPYILQAARKVRQTRHLSRASLYLAVVRGEHLWASEDSERRGKREQR